jgi:TonB-linked SusC/RagA family outer membrane protein
MKKLLLVSLCFLMLSITQVFAQNRTVTGTVTAKDDGLPIPGVTVKVKGTTTGTQTNAAGKFTISVPTGAVLVFTSVGYNATLLTPKGGVMNVTLEAVSQQLGEVVVTGALGIKTQERTLGAATATVSAKDLTETNVTNIANGLTAKVSGLAVYSLDNGIDPTVQIQLRGNRSLTGNNDALIVLDGVPIPNGSLSAINPNDIQDITVLKGAGSAALYGSEASNGAIVITTKRGNGNKPQVNYGNSFQLEKVSFYPKLQTEFGPYGGEPVSTGYLNPITGYSSYVPYENQEYGPAYNGQLVPIGAPLDSAGGTQLMVPYKAYPTSPIEAFFKTGVTEQNDISIQQGDANNSFFFSAQNVYRSTIVPNDAYHKSAFSARGKRTFGIFSVDYSLGYTKVNYSTFLDNNTADFGIPGSYVTNAGDNDLYASILQLPAFLNIKAYENPASDAANPNNYYDAYAINPYWIVDNARRNVQDDIILSTVNLKLSPASWVDINYRFSDNFGIDQEELTRAEVDFSPYAISDYYSAGNVPSGFGATGKAPGAVYNYYRFGDGTGNGGGDARLQGDALVNLHHKFVNNDLSANLLLGNTIWQQNQTTIYTGNDDLLINDFYNINSAGSAVTTTQYQETIRQISYYADLTLGWKNYLTLDGTFRNEHDSRLSAAERSFSYPSVKLAFVPTDVIPALKDNKVLNFLKIYGSISRVGEINIGPYEINNIYGLSNGFPFGYNGQSIGGYSLSSELYSPTLKPELTTAYETGIEAGLFNNRLNTTFTYYNEFDRNQTVPIAISSATGYESSLTNIGETQSQGYEMSVTGQILTQAQNKVGFSLGGNFSINNSKVISLAPGVNSFSLGNSSYAVVGQPFPLLEGTDFVRSPSGQIVVDPNTGYPSTNSSELKQFGRTTPKYNLGLNTTVSYKFVSFTVVAEYRGGDVIYNGIGSTLTFTGASAISASTGRQPFVFPNSVIQTASGGYVQNTNVNVLNGNYGLWQTSAYSGTTSAFVTSGAFWKIREADLAFYLKKIINHSHFVKGLTFSLTGRNLFMFLPKTNVYTDPEFSNESGDSNLRGVNDDAELPGTRVFGADLKVTF